MEEKKIDDKLEEQNAKNEQDEKKIDNKLQNQHHVMVGSVGVYFPKEPYPIQKAYMDMLVKCMEEKTNGLLESPTGTGKTLAILCAAVGWLKDKYQNVLNKTPSEWQEVPKIIYSSRTHVQLSQAMKELKKTAYADIPSVILASRDQLCLHDEVRILASNAAKTIECRLRTQNHTCQYYEKYEQKVSEHIVDALEVLDIEDITIKGASHTFCPYFASRLLQKRALVIFTPYNYLLDPHIRSIYDIDLKGSIIIFDEGHNIEQICEDSASRELSSKNLAMVIQTIDEIRQELEGEGAESMSEDAIPDVSKNDISEAGVSKDLSKIPIESYDITTQVLGDLKEALNAKIVEVKNIPDNKIPSEWLLNLLKDNFNLSSGLISQILRVLDKIAFDVSKMETSYGNNSNPKVVAIEEVSAFFRIVNVEEEAATEFIKKYALSLQTVSHTDRCQRGSMSNDQDNESWLLKVLCLSPSERMTPLKRFGAESIVITSGTLAPLESFQEEMEIPFPVILENHHIINRNQLKICTIDQYRGIDFDSRFANRHKPNYIRALGQSLIDFFRLVPDGVLIFFSSYAAMNTTFEEWDRTGLTAEMNQVKLVMKETTDKFSFDESLIKFKEVIDEKKGHGAAFFGVCRGKLSEGLDISDSYCRGVFIIGLPFPPYSDTKIVFKREYLTSKKNGMLTADAYYSIQMKRGLNQAIGRIIRHKEDYGVVVLMDKRFAQHKNSLAKWLRPFFNSGDYRQAHTMVKSFFESHLPTTATDG